MSKKLKLYIFLFSFIFLISFTNISYGKSYSIKDMDIQATVLDNGSVNVKQKITFDFSGDFNGIYLTVPYQLDDIEYDSYRQQSELRDSLYNIDDVIINKIQLNDKEFLCVPTAKNGDENVYTVSKENGIMTLKVFSPSYNEQKIFELDYILSNACVKHLDSGELYYNFIGGEWDKTIENLNIDVYLDEYNANLKIWGHGNYNGYSKIISPNHANFKTSDVRQGEYVAVRMLFDSDSIPNSTKLSEIDATNLVINDEEIIGQNLESKRNRIKKTFIFFIILLVYWVFLLFVYEIDKKYAQINIDEEELFKKYNPLIAGCIQGNRDVLSRDIIAVILNLINKKILTLELIPKISKTLKGDQYIYEISKNPEKEAEMDNIEKYICNWLFMDKNKIDFQERLEQLPKSSNASHRFKNISILAKNYLNSIGANKATVPSYIRFLNGILLVITICWLFSSLQQLVFNIFNKSQLIINIVNLIYIIILFFPVIPLLLYAILFVITSVRRKIIGKVQKYSGQKIVTTTISIIFIFSIIMIITSCFSSVRGLIFDELLICMAIIICLTDNLMLKNSNIILKDYSKLNMIKDKIKDYTLMDKRNIEEIYLWDQYLAYAISFGVAEKIMKKIKVMTIDDDLMNMVSGAGISYYVNSDYDDFYKYASWDSKFLKGYLKTMEKSLDFYSSSGGGDRTWTADSLVVVDSLAEVEEAGGRRRFLKIRKNLKTSKILFVI